MSRGARDEHIFQTYGTDPREVLVIGVPTFGMVSIYFAARFKDLRMPLNSIVRHIYVTGREIGIARNQIASIALNIEAESGGAFRPSRLLFLDDDLLFSPTALTTLIQRKLPIVSGLYYTKTDPAEPLMFGPSGTGVLEHWQHGDLVPVEACGMGLILIELEVFRALRDETDLGVDAMGYPNWFTTTRDGRSDLGVTNETEDVAFCRKARAAGFPVYVDTSDAAFAFHYDAPAQQGYPRRQWKQFVETGGFRWA